MKKCEKLQTRKKTRCYTNICPGVIIIRNSSFTLVNTLNRQKKRKGVKKKTRQCVVLYISYYHIFLSFHLPFSLSTEKTKLKLKLGEYESIVLEIT